MIGLSLGLVDIYIKIISVFASTCVCVCGLHFTFFAIFPQYITNHCQILRCSWANKMDIADWSRSPVLLFLGQNLASASAIECYTIEELVLAMLD